jgi:hypothetical protein
MPFREVWEPADVAADGAAHAAVGFEKEVAAVGFYPRLCG